MADITVIGGINIDIEGSPFRPLIMGDSNPGRIRLSFGGVGRNITENVARAGGNVAMISVVGDDFMGQSAVRQLSELGVDTSGILTLKGRTSSMYLSLLNHQHDMELAVSDMEILDALTGETLKSNEKLLAKSQTVALDGNLDESLLGQAIEMLKGKKLFFDPVSANKAVKGKKEIGKFYSIKPNRIEAEVLSGISIETEEDLYRAADWFLVQGVKQVFITLNRDGVFFCDETSRGFIRPKAVNLVSATGAGDSFSAMILLGMAEGRSIEETAEMGMAAASIAMESPSAVNEKLNREEIMRRMKHV
ncbi:MAG: carbohydrate kinase family protein [Anaerovoracaceae bacterium]